MRHCVYGWMGALLPMLMALFSLYIIFNFFKTLPLYYLLACVKNSCAFLSLGFLFYVRILFGLETRIIFDLMETAIACC